MNAAINNQFPGRIMAPGSKVKITGPDLVMEQMKAEISRLSSQYSLNG